MKKLLCCALALILTACNTADNRASISRMGATELASSSTGLVIFSTGAAKECISASTYLKLFNFATTEPVKDIPVAPIDVYVAKSDFTDHRGNISAYSLPPGKYYMSPMNANPYVVGTKVPAFAFEVAAGEAVYLGEIYMLSGCSLGASFIINNKYERDIAIAVQQNPALAQRKPVTRLIANSVAADGKATESTMEMSTPRALLLELMYSATRPPAAATGDAAEQWRGPMRCSERLDGKPGPSYEVEFTMERRGREVSVARNSATATETLAGRIENAALVLHGQGQSSANGRSWGLHFSGPFSESAGSWTGSGEMRANGGTLRNCTLQLRRR